MNELPKTVGLAALTNVLMQAAADKVPALAALRQNNPVAFNAAVGGAIGVVLTILEGHHDQPIPGQQPGPPPLPTNFLV
jgi:hypothetical protein